MESIKKEFTAGNFHHAFTAIDSDFPLDGDAKKAMSVLASANYESLLVDIRSENKSTVRKYFKQWESSIGPFKG